jgi:hypothetical protein
VRLLRLKVAVAQEKSSQGIILSKSGRKGFSTAGELDAFTSSEPTAAAAALRRHFFR